MNFMNSLSQARGFAKAAAGLCVWMQIWAMQAQAQAQAQTPTPTPTQGQTPEPSQIASTDLPSIDIRARAEDRLGVAQTASEGVVSQQRLATVPLMRPGEVLEMVPGMLVTQHAGDGKANQYFLRGFNLDHGTDFATFVGGVPVNMPSHAHGQGYTDLNFVIPELVQQISYRKGPYFAQEGDFASAGSARIDYRRGLDAGLAQLTVGPNGYVRTLLADSFRRKDLQLSQGEPSPGQWLYGLEAFKNNGPWTVPENYRKLNGVLRYSEGTALQGLSLTAMAYQGQWTSTDQVPQRALDQGLIGRYDSLDPTAGGKTQRYSLAGEWSELQGAVQYKTQAWLLQSALDLWSNFTGCLTDPSAACSVGDQFKQSERRIALGGSHTRRWDTTWQVGARSLDVQHAWGVQARSDFLSPVGLYTSRQRETLTTVREDRVQQQHLGLWAESEVRWTERLRTVTGVRADAYGFDVRANLPANSGKRQDSLVSPKLSVVWAPWRGTEWYLSHGLGFHSNDARGTTLRVDPSDPSVSAQAVSPLVRTRGEEMGFRTEWLPGWKTTLSVWQLRMASELLFVGDAGTTEPSRPSRRRGVEWNNFYALNAQWALDGDLAWSQARFTDGDPTQVGSFIPGAASTTANLGVTWDPSGPWSGALRLRYWGKRPLVEDNSWSSPAAAWLNLRLAYRASAKDQLALDVYNLSNRKLNDIEYAYVSRLVGETADGAMDRHVHPAEPRSLRLRWTHQF